MVFMKFWYHNIFNFNKWITVWPDEKYPMYYKCNKKYCLQQHLLLHIIKNEILKMIIIMQSGGYIHMFSTTTTQVQKHWKFCVTWLFINQVRTCEIYSTWTHLIHVYFSCGLLIPIRYGNEVDTWWIFGGYTSPQDIHQSPTRISLRVSGGYKHQNVEKDIRFLFANDFRMQTFELLCTFAKN